MKVTLLQRVLVTAWVLSFSFCVAVAIWFWNDIPSQRPAFLKNAVESYAPGLGVMLAATFVRTKSRGSRPKKDGDLPKSDWQEILAFGLSSLYLASLSCPVILFAFNLLESMADVNDIVSSIRPATSWLVVPVIAYYFGAKPAS